MKINILIAALLFTLGATQKADFKLEIGSKLPAKYVPKDNRNWYMTHSAQLRPYIERKVAGINYVIAYDKETRIIKYISTDDKEFKTVDGLQVGGYVEVNNEQARAYPGWEIRGAKDKDGWLPVIGFNNEMTILSEGEDVVLKLEPYKFHLDSPVKAKITAFVKGGG